MQTTGIVLLVTIGIIVTAIVAGRAVERGGSILKIVIGIGIGLLGGLIVVAMFGDLIPDEWESIGLAGLATLITLLLLGIVAGRWISR